MTDLVLDLMEALEPYDIVMSSFVDLRRKLVGDGLADTRAAAERAIHTYATEATWHYRDRQGHDYADTRLATLSELHETLIRAGKITGGNLADKLLIYAAHLATLSSYGPAIWDRVAKTVLHTTLINAGKELMGRQ